jgi:hypothetical protein
LEFDIRGTASENISVTETLPPRFAEAREYLAKIFGNHPSAIAKGPKDVKQLWSSLEQVMGARETWSVAVLRQLWGELFAGASKRRRSSEHERIFFQLLGYTLRPGFGYSLDEWRCEQTFKLFGEQVEFHKERPNWNEFWILWRRVSGGLTPEHQAEWWAYVKPQLALRIPSKAPKHLPRPKGLHPEGAEEMLRAAAAMEHLPPREKKSLGDLVAERISEQQPVGGPWAWALGRLGARHPLYGSVHNIVPPGDVATWIHVLIETPKLDGGTFALAQIARRTGDRLRDISDAQRARVATALSSRPNSQRALRTVEEIGELGFGDEARVFGDTLPLGLQLAR